MTSTVLAAELEVARRTVLRDVDALTEAGLPIIVHRGNQGGIELGFDYRTRLTGLDAAEAEALGILLARPIGPLAALGIRAAAARAATKLLEALPDTAHARALTAQERFRFQGAPDGAPDARVEALARAVRQRSIVRIFARSLRPRAIHPVALTLGPDGWAVVDEHEPGNPIPIANCGDINVSAKTFA